MDKNNYKIDFSKVKVQDLSDEHMAALKNFEGIKLNARYQEICTQAQNVQRDKVIAELRGDLGEVEFLKTIEKQLDKQADTTLSEIHKHNRVMQYFNKKLEK